MDSTKSIATKDGYSELRKSDLAQLAKELGLFESSGELASFLSEYEDGRITKSTIINGLRRVEKKNGPILKQLLQKEEARLIVYNPLEYSKPPSMYDDLLPSRYILNIDKLKRVREAGIVLPIKPYFDFNNFEKHMPTDGKDTSWPIPEGWITGLESRTGGMYRFLCVSCQDDLIQCDCKSTNDYVVSFLQNVLIEAGYNKKESFVWSLRLRFSETKFTSSPLHDVTLKLIKSEDWLQIPIIKDQPLNQFWESKILRVPYWHRNVRSIQKIAYLPMIPAYVAGVDKRLKKVLIQLRNIIEPSLLQWYCTSCTLPVIGLDTCFICGIGTKLQARIAQEKLEDEVRKVERIAHHNYKTVIAYREKMREKIIQEGIRNKQAAQRSRDMMRVLTKKQTNEAQLYLDQGLEVDFVIPLITGVIPAEDLMDFWDCEWRKQYSIDDSLIQLVLTGEIDYLSAKLLNKIRSISDVVYQFIIEYNKAFSRNGSKKVQGAHWSRMLVEVSDSFQRFETLNGDLRERAVLARMAGVGWHTILTHLGETSDGRGVDLSAIESTKPPRNSNQLFETQFTVPLSWGASTLHLQKFKWTKWNRLYFGHLILGIKPRIAKAYADKTVKEKSTLGLDDFCMSSWPKQYEVEDYLIKAFLDEKLNLKQVTKLNSIRSNHELLVRAVVLHPNIYQWVIDLLESGFEEHPAAAVAALYGAEPLVLGKVRHMKEKSPFPPALNMDLREIDLIMEIKWLEESIDFKK